MASHHVARELVALGHEVKQVPPAYSKPFRQGHKNDFRDAHAVAEAVERSSTRCVPIIAPHGRSIHKYMARRRKPPSQGWRTFLRNHADGIAAMDLFVVPTISFRLLSGLLILRHDRRRLLLLETTTHPTAEWIARQLTEVCGWDEAPRYLIRDRDRSYGEVFVRRVRAMGIRDRPTSLRSPWQNGYAERLIGSIRGECITNMRGLTCDRHRLIFKPYV